MIHIFAYNCSTCVESGSGKVKVCSNTAYGVVSVAAEPEYEMIGLQQRNTLRDHSTTGPSH